MIVATRHILVVFDFPVSATSCLLFWLACAALPLYKAARRRADVPQPPLAAHALLAAARAALSATTFASLQRGLLRVLPLLSLPSTSFPCLFFLQPSLLFWGIVLTAMAMLGTVIWLAEVVDFHLSQRHGGPGGPTPSVTPRPSAPPSPHLTVPLSLSQLHPPPSTL